MLCTNTTSSGRTITLRFLYSFTKVKSSVHPYFSKLAQNAPFKSMPLKNFPLLEAAAAPLPYSPCTPLYDITTFKNKDTPPVLGGWIVCPRLG